MKATNTPTHQASESWGIMLGLAAVLAWSTSSACVVWIGRQVGVWQYLAIGNGIGCIGQIIVYRLMGRSPGKLFVLPLRLWGLAILGFAFYSFCFATGLITSRTNAQSVGVSLMNYLWPVLTVLFSLFLIPGSRMSARLGAALMVSFSGLVIANWNNIVQVAHADGSLLPYVLGGLAGVSWAVYSAVTARWRDWARNYATAPAGFLLVSLIGITGCLLNHSWHPVAGRTWLVFLYLGLVVNAAGYLFWELALHRAHPAKLGLIGSATPVLSTVYMFILFLLTGQTRSLPTHWELLLLGAVLVAAAILMVSFNPRTVPAAEHAAAPAPGAANMEKREPT